MDSQRNDGDFFSKVAKRAAKFEIMRAIGRGDSVCEFVVTFRNKCI